MPKEIEHGGTKMSKCKEGYIRGVILEDVSISNLAASQALQATWDAMVFTSEKALSIIKIFRRLNKKPRIILKEYRQNQIKGKKNHAKKYSKRRNKIKTK